MALGLAIYFTAVGVFIATVGASIGIDQEVFRVIAAALLIIFGIVLLSGTLQEKFASATAGIGGSGNNLLSKVSTDSLSGRFILGLLLGVVWSPCVGPILGATITLASSRYKLGSCYFCDGAIWIRCRVTIDFIRFAFKAGHDERQK